jgi:hypothetical protein
MTKEKEKPKWTKRKNVPEVTKNWHNCMVKKVVQDFQVIYQDIGDFSAAKNL